MEVGRDSCLHNKLQCKFAVLTLEMIECVFYAIEPFCFVL